MPCAGDAGEICGGDNANLVFENLVEPDGGWNEVESPPGFIPQPDVPPPADGAVRLRVMSWNVFYASLGAESRKEGVAQTLADYGPDIVSLQEMWGERFDILAKTRAKTGRNYALATSGPQEQFWDGDIMYDRDLFSIVSDGVTPLNGNDGSRAMSWAVLRHNATGALLQVYGIHPVCCSDDFPVLLNMEWAVREFVQRSDAPTLFLGDFNAWEGAASQNLLRNGFVNAFNRDWTVPLTFTDTFREKYPDADGNTGFGPKIDYVWAENRDVGGRPAFVTVEATIRRDAPGGSDHFPVSAVIDWTVA